jgi:hypothetical protein
LRLDGFDLRLKGRGVDPKQDFARPQRRIRGHGNIDHFTRNIRNDRDRVARDDGRALRRAPAHRDQKAEQQQNEYDEW